MNAPTPNAPTPNPFDAPEPTTGDLMDDAFEGAGIASSMYDVVGAVQGQDGPGILAASTVAALDALSLRDDPADVLARAGVGWLIEHVSILREPLDALCGDAAEIEDRANGWERLSRSLRTQADSLESSLGNAAGGWSGSAARSYGAAAVREADGLRALAEDCRKVGELVLQSGVLVGTERAIIRDLIAEFLVWLVPKAVAALTATAATAGVGGVVSGGLLIADIIGFANDLWRRTDELLTVLGRMTAAAQEVAANVAKRASTDTMDGVTAAVPGAAESLTGIVTDRAPGMLLEHQKQSASGRETLVGWGPPPGTAIA
ncbi:WXG100 family type VII secretion target [Pseudonocardia sp. HH130630-07]|uniref:WXG100 family type VII secretion target n=1 Tax=Pseudonocardia sp. HH130630-07 TaxID=1690815 RepID=UPI000814F6F7|nr:PPE domain-containing protein [Pseudonocardia sp. HH130630-07]ANY06873.1 hypothetical protein AFB00_11875 [Pseudonocardia sp. HH130630-07]